MFQDYNTERITLFSHLLESKEAFLIGKPWLFDPAQIRFKLGETLSDLKIPYHLGKEDDEIIEAAIMSLVSILKERYHKDDGEQAQKVQRTFGSVTATKGEALLDTTYWLGVFKQNSLEINLAENILNSTPLMDSAILKQWLDKDGKGQQLLQWTSDVMEKALSEEAKAESGEMTSYMALLAIIAAIREKKERIKEVSIKGTSLERVDLATGFTLFMTIQAAINALFVKIQSSESIFCNPATETVLKSAIIPEAFLLIPSVLLNSSLNPYGIRAETIQVLSPYITETTELGADLNQTIETAYDGIRKDKKAIEELSSFCLTTRIRGQIIDYLMKYDLPGTKGQELFYDLYREDRQMQLRDPKNLDSLSSLLSELSGKYAKDSERVAKYSSFHTLIDTLRTPKNMIKWAKTEAGIGVIKDKIRGFLAYKLDSHAGQFTKGSSETMVNRREKFSGDMLLEEFNNGRLYRFSNDRRDILRGLTIEQEGQLIIDMKDFTKKTLKLKEIAMADFMKENFYEPILNAAKKYGIDHGLVDKDAGISLNGLPGDAAIFSGGVANLVSLAEDISKIIREYREKVKEKFLPKLDKHIQTIHEKFLSEQKRVAEEKEDLKELAGDDETLIDLGEEVEELIDDISREELEAVITEEMDAGLFITFGVKAETMLLESSDGSLDAPVKVAIGEKINEASRGTTRSESVMNKLAMLLDREKSKRNNPDLLNPFEVHIDNIYSIRITKELEDMLESDLEDRSESEKSGLIDKVMDEYINDLEKLRQEMPASSLKVLNIGTQIYNKGHALSKEALTAFIKETTGRRFFFKKNIRTDELNDAILDKFFFPKDRLELWFGVEITKGSEKVLIFSRSGQLTFKGFESSPPTEVYEILDSNEPFFKALLEIHFKGWFSEAKSLANEKYKEMDEESTS
jgi:hypothetical protein